jgi:pimeloyl-ACP methyl ester carboxylesterase
MRRRYVDTECGQLHCYKDGESGPLIFLFHETALSGSEFERTLPYLGERCRAIAFDTPGYGMSDPPRAPLDMPALAKYLRQGMEVLGNESCILAGAHTGSSIALELAAHQMKDQVTHLVLTGLALLTPSEIAEFREIIGKPTVDPEGIFLTDMWQARRQRRGEHTDLNDILWGTVEQLKAHVRSTWAYEAVFSYDHVNALRDLDCPTLFLVGEHDSLVECDRKASKLARDAELKVLPGMPGRLPYFEPKLYAQEVLDFAGLT